MSRPGHDFGGGSRRNSPARGVPSGSFYPDPISDQKCNFPLPFSDRTSKIHTRFQTWPLGRGHVIITYIRAQTKQNFKAIPNSRISLSLLLIWN